MLWFFFVLAIIGLYLIMNAPQLLVLIIAFAAIGVHFLPYVAPEPVHDSSVRAPKDYSGHVLILVPALILTIAVISGIISRWF